jgi:hypothetical protein
MVSTKGLVKVQIPLEQIFVPDSLKTSKILVLKVNEYMHSLPMVLSIIYDGKNYWLKDNFELYLAHKYIGTEIVTAYLSPKNI